MTLVANQEALSQGLHAAEHVRWHAQGSYPAERLTDICKALTVSDERQLRDSMAGMACLVICNLVIPAASHLRADRKRAEDKNAFYSVYNGQTGQIFMHLKRIGKRYSG